MRRQDIEGPIIEVLDNAMLLLTRQSRARKVDLIVDARADDEFVRAFALDIRGRVFDPGHRSEFDVLIDFVFETREHRH